MVVRCSPLSVTPHYEIAWSAMPKHMEVTVTTGTSRWTRWRRMSATRRHRNSVCRNRSGRIRDRKPLPSLSRGNSHALRRDREPHPDRRQGRQGRGGRSGRSRGTRRSSRRTTRTSPAAYGVRVRSPTNLQPVVEQGSPPSPVQDVVQGSESYRCDLCGRESPEDFDKVAEEGWYPNFFEGEEQTGGPVCPQCLRRFAISTRRARKCSRAQGGVREPLGQRAGVPQRLVVNVGTGMVEVVNVHDTDESVGSLVEEFVLWRGMKFAVAHQSRRDDFTPEQRASSVLLPVGCFRPMTKTLFAADRFTPTPHSTAEEKARFCAAFAKFVLAGFPRHRFKHISTDGSRTSSVTLPITTLTASTRVPWRPPPPPRSSGTSSVASTSTSRWAIRISAE